MAAFLFSPKGSCQLRAAVHQKQFYFVCDLQSPNSIFFLFSFFIRFLVVQYERRGFVMVDAVAAAVHGRAHSYLRSHERNQ